MKLVFVRSGRRRGESPQFIKVNERIIEAGRILVGYLAIPEVGFITPGPEEVVLVQDAALDVRVGLASLGIDAAARCAARSEEHTSELQSRENLVCRLLLEKKNVA